MLKSFIYGGYGPLLLGAGVGAFAWKANRIVGGVGGAGLGYVLAQAYIRSDRNKWNQAVTNYSRMSEEQRAQILADPNLPADTRVQVEAGARLAGGQRVM
jgi:hypothetical protein